MPKEVILRISELTLHLKIIKKIYEVNSIQ